MNILITGGGSGGHVSPALAVASYLQQHYPQAKLLYVGGTMTMEGSSGPSVEQTMVQATTVPFVAISAGKLRRDGLSLKTLTRLVGVIPGFFEAFKVVRQFKPDVVFSSGGYVVVPVVLAAKFQGVPVIIHEQTAAVGLANRLTSRLAAKVAITFPQSAQFFNQSKVVLTGNPLNQAIAKLDSTQVYNTPFGDWLAKKSALPLLYVTGGGLGSHKINVAIEQLLPELLATYRVIHQTGSNQHYADYPRLQALAQQLPNELAQNYWVSQHFSVQQVGCIYQRAQTVVARAGANTVLELAYWNIPTVFIPIPWVTHDEQTKNAQTLTQVGLATILKEANLRPDSLLEAIQQVGQIDRGATQADAINLVRPDATQHIVQLLLDQIPTPH